MESDPALDADVAALVEENAAERGVPFRRALNDLVRDALGEVPEQKAGHVERAPRRKSFHLGRSLIDETPNISELLEKLEGPLHK